MKILMVNKFFYKKGGAENHMFALSDLLKKNGHQVINFAMKHEKNEQSKYEKYFIEKIVFEFNQGIIKLIKNVLHAIYSLEAQKKIEELIKAEKPDIAHLHNISFQITPSIIKILKKYNIPVVMTLHDNKLICSQSLLSNNGQVCEKCKSIKHYQCFLTRCIKRSFLFGFIGMFEMYLHRYILKSYDKIDQYISPSNFIKENFKQWNFSIDNFNQLYNFIDLKKLQPSDHVGNGLVYFGRLSKEKGIMTLLSAMKDLPNIDLKLIGSGDQRQEIEKYIEKNNMKNVKLFGFQKGEALFDLIKNARLVVMPSIVYENNPLAVLEAFALAKPVIGSNLGGIPELVQEGFTGYLFKPNNSNDLRDKIKIHYNDKEELVFMGENARKFVEKNCSQEKYYYKISDIYESLISTNIS